MSALDTVLDRLTRVKRTKPGNWKSACPCCESRKGQPLTISEGSDGRVLIHAFCGCSTEDVLGRLGLTITDLFDRPLATHLAPSATRVPAGELLKTLSAEVSELAVIAADFLERRTISEPQWARLADAARRIGHAADYVKAK
jgi:hypothetical protein